MKYSLFAIAATFGTALATAAPAEDLVERAACSAATINTGVRSIVTAVNKLDTDFRNIKTSDGSDINLSTFLNDSTNLIKVIQGETSKVKGCSPGVDKTGADNIQKQVTLLVQSASKLASDIIAKKKQVSSRGLQGILRSQASSQSSVANAFGTALRSKIPSSLTATANADISKINKAFSSVFSAFPA